MPRPRPTPAHIKGTTTPDRQIPRPPSGLLAESRRRWVTFWSSDLASVVVPEIDLPALSRLWMMYDERTRAARVLRKEGPTVRGYKGQPRPNPLNSRIGALDIAIARAEDRFGMSPASRLRLGIGVRDTVGDFNRAFADFADDEDDDGEYAAGDYVTVMDGTSG